MEDIKKWGDPSNGGDDFEMGGGGGVIPLYRLWRLYEFKSTNWKRKLQIQYPNKSRKDRPIFL